jgi:integrase
VSDLRLHDLRHTAATALLKAPKGNLRTVQRMLRHRDIRSTLRYAHADDDDVLAALEAASPAKSPEASPEAESKLLKSHL